MHDHAPPTDTVAEHTVDAPSVTVTEAPGSPVPDTIGVESDVVEPSAGPEITGAAGPLESTVNDTGADAGDTLPAGSSCVASSECGPSDNGVTGVHDHVPPAPTVAVHTVDAPSTTVTHAPG